MQIDDAIHGIDIEIVDLSAAGPVAATHLLPAVLVPAFSRKLEFRSSQQVGVGLPRTDWRVLAAPALMPSMMASKSASRPSPLLRGEKVVERSCGDGMLMSRLARGRGRLEAVVVERRRVERVLMESIVGWM